MRMHGAQIVVGPGLVQNDGEFFAAIDRLRAENARGADDIVRLLVVVDPGDRGPRFDGQDRWYELKALDRDLGFTGRGDLLWRRRLLLSNCAGRAEGEEDRRGGESPPRHKATHD